MIDFLALALQQLPFWIENDRKTELRILCLIKEIRRNPFDGVGKPEPFKGFWSRRITDEHRLIYKYTDGQLIIHSCRFHYS